MTKLIHLHHMNGDTVTPRHYNALVDVVNRLVDVVNQQNAIIDALAVTVRHQGVGIDRLGRR